MAKREEEEDSAMIQKILAETGMSGLQDMLLKKVNAWKELNLSIAVIGSSGSGKSMYINAIRDLKEEDEEVAPTGAIKRTNEVASSGAKETTNEVAPTGAIETTKQPKSYIHPEHPNLEFWDLPGVGTESFPQKTYLEQVNFKIYDFFLILSSVRFTEYDCWLAKEIQQSGRKFFFIRTQIDVALDGEKKSKPRSFKEGDVLEKVRSDCRNNLEKNGLANPTVFLLSSFHKESWDFQAAKEKLIEEFPDLKKEAILFSLSCHTDRIITRKKEQLSKRVYIVAVASAIGALAPVPGVSTLNDIAIITFERQFYRKQFGLDQKSLESIANDLHLSVSSLVQIIQGSACLAVQVTEMQIVSDTAELLVSAAIPVLGCLLSAGISYGATYLKLRKLLDDTEADARKLAAFVQKHVKALADTCID